jgi:hypothetical protein
MIVSYYITWYKERCHEGQTGRVCRAASDEEPAALNPETVRLLIHQGSVPRAGLEQEEDGEAHDEPRHDQRQRRRRRRHAEVLRQRRRAARSHVSRRAHEPPCHVTTCIMYIPGGSLCRWPPRRRSPRRSRPWRRGPATRRGRRPASRSARTGWTATGRPWRRRRASCWR